jgi:undecaprenyl phosphate N,N'-diacetylbacillosamine 1-phosphate transferase
MYKGCFKRIFDLVISLLGLPIFLLLYFPICILIKIEDHGPVFYNAKRLGKNGKLFNMYKFRSMKVNSPDIRLADGSTFNSKDDFRLTKIGKFLRGSSLDEIPQFLNVLKGDMSLIGPRPDITINKSSPEKSFYKMKVKPGITGYNQVYFRNQSIWLEKLDNDIYYIDHLSFLLDMKIFIKSIYIVLKSEKTYRKHNDI